MEYGFVKVAAAVPEIRVGDTEYNAKAIIATIQKAEQNGIKLIVFPELVTSGATCGDMFFSEQLQNDIKHALGKIANKTGEIIAIVGAALKFRGKLYDCAVAISGGRILGVTPKSYLANFEDFSESRFFTAGKQAIFDIDIDGQVCPFGTNIIYRCHEMPLFAVGCEVGSDAFAPVTPAVHHVMNGASIIACPSAIAEFVGRFDRLNACIQADSERLACAYICAGAGDGESTTDFVYAGRRLIMEDGEVLQQSKPFECGLTVTEIDVKKLAYLRGKNNLLEIKCDEYIEVPFCCEPAICELTRPYSTLPFVPENFDAAVAELILTMQAEGLKKRLKHTGVKCAVLGISGGLDSALSLIVTVRAFEALKKPLSDIVCVTMPCFGTTNTTKMNAEKLVEALGCTLKKIDIRDAVAKHLQDIGHSGKLNAAYENAQARMRTMILMDMANDIGGLVVGTGDLSELALGFATYNGDHMAMYGTNAGVTKTLARKLVGAEAERMGGKIQAVLSDILNTAVSPELLPSKSGEIEQRTENIIGSYELNDFILYHFLQDGYSPEKLRHVAEYAFQDAFSAEEIAAQAELFFKRFYAAQFKRSCMPDGMKITAISLSPRGGLVLPSDYHFSPKRK